ncbi:FGGY family carbohydrate kinase [Nonomuraea thailandensis]
MTPGTPRPVTAGIDVGTTHVKVGFFDERGGCVAAVRRPTPRSLPGLVAAVTQGLGECAERAGRAPAAIGIAGMAETGVPLGASGGAHPAAVVERPQGRRGDRAAAPGPHGPVRADRAVGRRQGAARQVAVAAEPGAGGAAGDAVVGERAGRGGVRAHGVPRTHATLAARTLGYHVERGEYDADLLALAGMSGARLPDVRAAVEPVGGVVARVSGVAPGTPVVIAGHDHAVGAWAAGCGGRGTRRTRWGRPRR